MLSLLQPLRSLIFFFPPLNASESFTHEGQSVANTLLSFVPPLCCTFCFIFFFWMKTPVGINFLHAFCARRRRVSLSTSSGQWQTWELGINLAHTTTWRHGNDLLVRLGLPDVRVNYLGEFLNCCVILEDASNTLLFILHSSLVRRILYQEPKYASGTASQFLRLIRNDSRACWINSIKRGQVNTELWGVSIALC